MCALVLLSLSTALVGDGAAVFKTGTDQEVLQAIAKGYTENRGPVERCRASFFVVEARGASLAAARRGELEDPVRARGSYLLDGSKRKYERLFDRKGTISHTTPSTKGGLGACCEFVSTQMLSDGEATLVYIPSYNPYSKEFDKHAWIQSGDDEFRMNFNFPLNLGLKEPDANGVADMLERFWAHEAGSVKAVMLKRDVEFAGRNVHVVTFDYGESETSYWIDYERGCLPLRILFRTDKEGDYYDEQFDHVALVGGKLWFPFRKLHYCPITRRVRILEVEHIEIGTPIAHADFQLLFVEPIGIHDRVGFKGYKNIGSFPLTALARPWIAESRPARNP